MSALTDVQAAFVTSLAGVASLLTPVETLSVDTPIEIVKAASVYSKARAVIVAALPASATAQADAAAASTALEAVLDAVTTLTGDTPIERVKDAHTAFKAAGVVIAAL